VIFSLISPGHSRHIKNVCFAAREMENKSTKHLLHMFRCCSLGWFWFWCLLLPTLSRGDSLGFLFFLARSCICHTLCVTTPSPRHQPASVECVGNFQLIYSSRFSTLISSIYENNLSAGKGRFHEIIGFIRHVAAARRTSPFDEKPNETVSRSFFLFAAQGTVLLGTIFMF
jgi:hypothetical protein